MQSVNSSHHAVRKLQESGGCTGQNWVFQPGSSQPASYEVVLEARQLAGFMDLMFVICRQEGVSFIVRRSKRMQARLTIQLIDVSMQTVTLDVTVAGNGGAARKHADSAGPGSAGGRDERIPLWLTGRKIRVAPRTTAVVGPDGSGKTALIDALKASPVGSRYQYQRFKRFFRRVLFHIRKSQDRNSLESTMQWLILPVAWPYFYWSRYVSNRFRHVVLDRYFYDYFVRNIRDPRLPPQKVTHYELCSRLTPAPDRLVVAMCSVDTILTRKSEMSAEAIEYLYAIYREQILDRLPMQTLFCHTGIEQSASVAHLLYFKAPQTDTETGISA